MNSKDDEKKLHPKILELLEEIKKSQEINREDANGQTPLLLAAINGQIKMLNYGPKW